MTYALTLGPVHNYLNLPRISQFTMLIEKSVDPPALQRLIMNSPQAQTSAPPDPAAIADTTVQAIEAASRILSSDPALEDLFYFQVRIGPQGRTSYVLDGILDGEHLVYTARIPGGLDGDAVSGVRVVWPITDSGTTSLFGDPRLLGGDLRRRGLVGLAGLSDSLLGAEAVFVRAAEAASEWSPAAA